MNKDENYRTQFGFEMYLGCNEQKIPYIKMKMKPKFIRCFRATTETQDNKGVTTIPYLSTWCGIERVFDYSFLSSCFDKSESPSSF